MTTVVARLRAGARRLRPRRPSAWGALVPVVFAAAGLLATASAQTARGTDLRSVGRTDTVDLIREQQHRADVEEAQVGRLRRDVQALTERAAPAGSGSSGWAPRAPRPREPPAPRPCAGRGSPSPSTTPRTTAACPTASPPTTCSCTSRTCRRW
nr:hypothetical protein [Angustibacter aerolatus]